MYILHNVTKDKYYVGQGKSVIQRVSQRFAGHGNRDVHADYEAGDEFRIKNSELQKTNYASINDLERDCIERYDAFTKGLNRNRGNRA